ncbi:DUF397 domain-containing protein [Pseudonocardia alni]|uniref:DUF397 domain-containing protein n=1 Tax=Pseudonocardia alni TaxID=33907 RepID=UPI00280B2133|nr:DUF397 domain-containing protein [Pseudonocardia alni]
MIERRRVGHPRGSSRTATVYSRSPVSPSGGVDVPGPCTESVPEYRKSSYSGTDNCVEVSLARVDDIRVRNSREDSQWVLKFTRDEWTAFIAGVKAGEFDLT